MPSASKKRGVQVFDHDAILERVARALVGRDAVDVPATHAAAEEQHAAGVGEVAVHAVVLRSR